MTSRREFLQVGLTGGALLVVPALAGPPAVGVANTGLPAVALAKAGRIYKVIFDERFPESVAFARDMHRRGVPKHGISGDVTALWYDDLHFAWSKGPVQIAGMTTKESLFCLETLARDASHRVTSRQTLESGLVSWTIGPKMLHV